MKTLFKILFIGTALMVLAARDATAGHCSQPMRGSGAPTPSLQPQMR